MSASLLNYEKKEKLGEGTYGVVYKAVDRRTGETVALKKIRLDQEDEGIPATSLREISILKDLKHPNIVELKEVINQQGRITMVMEFLDMDLKKFLDNRRTKMDPALVKSYAYQILAGMYYCHSHRVIHRDMKSSNLLINRSGLIKICDFGLARAFTIPLRSYTHEVVTLWYRAPEILLGSKYYSLPIDVWSVGCIIAEMASGKPIFQGDSEIDQLFAIFKVLGTPSEDVWPGVTSLPSFSDTFPSWKRVDMAKLLGVSDPLLVDLIEQTLKYDPAARISAKQALSHPYFNDLDESIKRTCKVE